MMIETTIAAYTKKVYAYDFEKNRLRCKYEDLYELIKRMNPNSIYWKDHDPLQEDEWYEV
ncbi:MAG: hypothetical protein ABS68_07600 [Niastella sp. SCN 39-18]|nr:MAG: hypothetical protein ABS68_07600 [Niastella sp. SCN 39-18]